MSYSRSSIQPSVSHSRVNSRGRGSGPGLSPAIARGQGTVNSTYERSVGAGRRETGAIGDELDAGTGQIDTPERRMEYRGAYSVMAPDEKKRTQIQQQAERERQNYEQYKQANKLRHVSYVGTVGGASTSGGGAKEPGRSRLLQQPGRYERMEQRNRYREEAKVREEEEYRVKKENARRQTERNAMRSQTDLDRRSHILKDDHRRTNAAFLDRLEGKR